MGLMEAGHLAIALERIKRFKPVHPLPLLSLHMGAFLIERVRGGTKEQKRYAKEVGLPISNLLLDRSPENT